MNEFYNKHYIRINDQKLVIKGFSDAFEQPQDDDICINEQGGYQFRLFPNGAENPALTEENGIYLYKYIDGEVQARTQEEIQADIANIEQTTPPISETQQLRADVDYLSIMTGVDL